MSKVRMLGIPHDLNSSYLRGAAEAPSSIRRELWSDAYSTWTESGFDLSEAGRVEDEGDIDFLDSTDSTDPWALIEHRVGDVLQAGDPLICLGGDHAITYPIMRAVRRRNAALTIIHIDAHPDIYDSYQNNPRSHTSPFARIMEEQLTDRLVQVGLRTINSHHRDQFKRFNVEVIEASCCNRDIDLNLKTPAYVSLDIDALDPSCAPGVSHREPGGLLTRDVIRILQNIDQPIVAADIVEYNPRQDISNMTALVAAKLLKELAGVMLRNRPGGALEVSGERGRFN